MSALQDSLQERTTRLRSFRRRILRFTTPGRPGTAAACYVALWQLPRPDFHRLVIKPFKAHHLDVMPPVRTPSRAGLKRTVLASNKHPHVQTATRPHPVAQISEAFPLFVLAVLSPRTTRKRDLVRQQLLTGPESLDILRFLAASDAGKFLNRLSGCVVSVGTTREGTQALEPIASEAQRREVVGQRLANEPAWCIPRFLVLDLDQYHSMRSVCRKKQ